VGGTCRCVLEVRKKGVPEKEVAMVGEILCQKGGRKITRPSVYGGKGEREWAREGGGGRWRKGRSGGPNRATKSSAWKGKKFTFPAPL